MVTRSGKPAQYKPWSAPKVRYVQKEKPPHDRRAQYDEKWRRLSIKFRKSNPFCRFCQQEGRDTPATQVDHIKPWEEFPELRYEWKNLESLCFYHHSVTKQKLENYARKHGRLDELPEWCSDPRTRPDELKPFMAI